MTRQITIILLTCGLLTTIATGQTFQRTFGGMSDDYLIAVQQTSDGGYVAAGQTKSFGVGNGDIYLVKTDGDGNLQWDKAYGASAEDFAFDVKQTTDGGYIIAGWTESFGAGGQDCYLIKTNSTGDTSWTKAYGGTGDDNFYGVQETSDNGFILTGWTSSFGVGGDDIYIVKTNSTGDTLWTRTIGGNAIEISYSVQETSDNGYIITGVTYSIGAGAQDAYLIKLDINGNLLWSKTYGGTGADYTIAVIETADSGFAIAGITASFGAGLDDIYLIRTNSIGDTLWTKAYGGSGWDAANALVQNPDGGFTITGNSVPSFSDAYVIRVDALGDTIWTKTYGGSSQEYSNAIDLTTDNGYIISGMTSSFGAGAGDGYLIKLNSNGLVNCNQASYPTSITQTTTSVASGASLGKGGFVSSTATVISTPSSTDSTLCYTVGIQDNHAFGNYKIYPNPTTQRATLEFDNSRQVSYILTLYDIHGRLVRAISNINTSKLTIDTGDLTGGLYFFQMHNDRQVCFTGKLTIE